MDCIECGTELTPTDHSTRRKRTMSMFDLTTEGSFGMNPAEPDEKAVTALLKPPATAAYVTSAGATPQPSHPELVTR